LKKYTNKAFAFRAAALAGLSLLIIGRTTHVQHARSVASEPHGRYTLNQIVERSLPLCGALAANVDSLTFAGSPLSAWTNGKEVPVWSVDGVDAQDRFKVHLEWNADTGELMAASRPLDGLALRNGRKQLQRNEALRITSSWLTTLGIFELDSDWRPDSAPQDSDYVWRIEWRTDTRDASVIIDSRTGELIMAQSMKGPGKVEHYKVAQRSTAAGLRRL
jgi:hypothetical protein